jgi:hypothetical protein
MNAICSGFDATYFCSTSSFKSTAATQAPLSVTSEVIALQIPAVPPVTIITLSFLFFMIIPICMMDKE